MPREKSFPPEVPPIKIGGKDVLAVRGTVKKNPPRRFLDPKRECEI